jgi:hypothetical protein
MTAVLIEVRRSQNAATEELLRAFFEGGGFALKMRERFAGEMQ